MTGRTRILKVFKERLEPMKIFHISPSHAHALAHTASAVHTESAFFGGLLCCEVLLARACARGRKTFPVLNSKFEKASPGD